MKNNFTLSDRKRALLLNTVESYIENALPITSEKAQVNYFSSLSSATLRNELNALEEMGYLKQLHTSGGRIPTTKAYRYFVNSVIESNEFDLKDIELIEGDFLNRSTFLLEVLEGLAKKVNSLIDYPTVVELKGFKELVIVAVNTIPLITGEVLVLMQTNAGIINNTIQLKQEISEENLKDASKFLTINLKNKKITEVIQNFDYYNNLFRTQIKYFEELFLSITQMLKSFATHGTVLKRGNTTKILNELDYKDINSAKKFLKVLENEDKLKEIIQNIDNSTDSDIVFSIGDENNDEEINDYSIIKANYSLANGIVASVGVMGPERMDYVKIASVLKYINDKTKRSEDE